MIGSFSYTNGDVSDIKYATVWLKSGKLISNLLKQLGNRQNSFC